MEDLPMPKKYEVAEGYRIQMGSGKVVDPFALRAEDIELSDIVNNLAHEVRFGGNAGGWTVAQHTLVVAELVRMFGKHTDAEYMSALLHDAGEAYLKDMPKPIKHRPDMLAYRQAEERAMRVICEKFGVACDLPIVKEMDNVATYLEAKMFLGKLAECWTQWEPEVSDSVIWYGVEQITAACRFPEKATKFWALAMSDCFGAPEAQAQEGK
jgi:hypothetical protein